MPTPSPVCTISSGPTPADVSASSTINGALASTAGANFWGITCISADDSSSVATVNASLVVNQGPKTFSFTSGAAGTAFIFQSTVGVNGLGLDANSVPQASFTTTFKVNVKTTTHALRVLVAGEKLEQDAVNGWIAEINAAIRLIG